MGLSQRKVKQRIGPDPRNLSWGDDAARFGQAYLEKLGWSSGTGLGAAGDGRASHITVKQKLNMLGIGADSAGMNGDPMVAWKQGKDFDSVLTRLNATSEEGPDEGSNKRKKSHHEDMEDGSRKFKKPRSGDASPEQQDDSNSVANDNSDKAKRKEEKRRRKEEKRNATAHAADATSSAQAEEDSPVTQIDFALTSTPPAKPNIPRHRAHRSKFLRSKQLANGNDAAMNQILGIASSETPTPGVETPIDVEEPPPPSKVLGIDDGLIKTHTISVADYFKAKLAAKLSAGSPVSKSPVPEPAPSPPTTPEEETPIDEKEEKRRRKQEKKDKKEQKRRDREAAAA
ncbi:hypothetical protein BKA62DRAFT_118970 [Auriculariales sp. MPI-PUGE-AT-0066]|nr:hypothetical protein BKA62DRAFT_118970 [Auriculariales sp. MPI-PUGE-AT-0066]